MPDINDHRTPPTEFRHPKIVEPFLIVGEAVVLELRLDGEAHEDLTDARRPNFLSAIRNTDLCRNVPNVLRDTLDRLCRRGGRYLDVRQANQCAPVDIHLRFHRPPMLRCRYQIWVSLFPRKLLGHAVTPIGGIPAHIRSDHAWASRKARSPSALIR